MRDDPSWIRFSQTRVPGGLDFGDISQHPIWIGDFTGVGHSQVLFYSAHEGYWWLGTNNGGTLSWLRFSETRVGNGPDFFDTRVDPSWVGDFTGVGHSQVLFYSTPDGSWWLGTNDAGQLNWGAAPFSQTYIDASVSAPPDFFDAFADPISISDFTGVGHSQVLFYSESDGDWMLKPQAAWNG